MGKVKSITKKSAQQEAPKSLKERYEDSKTKHSHDKLNELDVSERMKFLIEQLRIRRLPVDTRTAYAIELGRMSQRPKADLVISTIVKDEELADYLSGQIKNEAEKK